MQNKEKWLLIFGALGAVGGFVYHGGQLFYNLGYYLIFPEYLVEAGFEVLYIAYLLGIGLGWLGLGARFYEDVSRVVGWVKIGLLADLYLFGFLSLLGELGSYVWIIILLLQVVALVQLYRIAQPKLLFLVSAIALPIFSVLGWLLSSPMAGGALSMLSYVVLIALFGLPAFPGILGKGGARRMASGATVKGRQLLLTPSFSFMELKMHLQSIGFVENPGAMVTAPLIPGEPELANFHGPMGMIIYTFNPVVSLRVLDLSAAANAAQIETSLRLSGITLGEAELRGFLQSRDPRQRLLGIWGAQALGLRSMSPVINLMYNDPDRSVASAASSFLSKVGSF